MPAPLKATVAVEPTADVAGLVLAAGGRLENARLSEGMLTVRGVSQEALEAAAAAGAGGDPLYADRMAVIMAAERQHAIETAKGMPWRGKVLQIHQEALNDLTAMTVAANNGMLPPDFAWRMLDNSFLPMDADAMVQMAAAAMRHTYGLLLRYWQIKADAEAAPDAEALHAIDLLAGWQPVPA